MVYIKLLLTAFIWGGTFVAGRLLADGMGPFTAAFLRFLLASLCLLILVRRFEGGLPSLSFRGWIGVSLLGATGVFAYNVLFFWGLHSVPAGRAAIIVATNPVLLALLGALFFKEGLSRKKLGGVLLSVSGAITVIARGDVTSLFSHAVSMGDLIILGCVASWVSYSLLGKRMMQGLSPVSAVTFSCLTGTVMLFPCALYEGMATDIVAFTQVHWGALAYLGVLGTVVGFTWFYQGVKVLGASKAGVFINFVPVTAILSGWFVLGEPISASLLTGGLMVVGGVFLTNKG